MSDISTGRDIGWALYAMRHGDRVRRPGWNGKGMWLAFVSGAQWDLSADLEPQLSNQGAQAEAGYTYRGPFIAMRAAMPACNASCISGRVCSWKDRSSPGCAVFIMAQ